MTNLLRGQRKRYNKMIILRQKQFGFVGDALDSSGKLIKGIIRGARDHEIRERKYKRKEDSLKNDLLNAEYLYHGGLEHSTGKRTINKYEKRVRENPMDTSLSELDRDLNQGYLESRLDINRSDRKKDILKSLERREAFNRSKELLQEHQSKDPGEYKGFFGNAGNIISDTWKSGNAGKAAVVGTGTVAAGTLAGLGYLGYRGAKKLKAKRAARRLQGLQKLGEADQQ